MPASMMDLRKQYAGMKEEIDAAVLGVLETQHFRGGPIVEEFERAIAELCGAQQGIAVSTGTDAILLPIKALDLEPGDEVITTPFTFFATAGATVNGGGVPIFVDIEPDTFNIDTKLIEAQINERTKAIVAVHIFGQCADMDEILALAKKHDLVVIEDVAQSLGARYRGRPAGSMGAAAGTSFYPSKNLGAAGEGGLVVATDKALGDKVRLLRSHGAGRTYYHDLVGTNSHLPTIQAAVLQVKLKYLAGWNARRGEIAALYHRLFAEMPEVTRPAVREYNDSVWHQYVIRLPRRDEALEFLKARGIECGVFYPLPLNKQKCFAHLKSAQCACPVAEQASREVLALPIHADLTDEQVHEVVDGIKAFLAGK